jgi:hypothetical protein
MVVKAAVGRGPMRGRSGLGIGARRSEAGAVGGGDAGVPFYRVRGGAGRPSDGGEWAAVVVHHDGGGGGRFGRGLAGAVMGSDEGECSGRFRTRRGVGALGGRGGSIGHSARGLRRLGGAHVSVREDRARWLGWPKAEAQWCVAAAAQGELKGSGPARVEGEVGRCWAKFGVGPEFKKKFFSNYN